MDEFIQAGYDRDEAAAKVTKALQKSGYKVRAITVRKWRDRCKEGRNISDDAVAEFRKPLPASYGDTPALRAENLLKALEGAKASIGG